MAYITAKETKQIRTALKEKYPNLKFSVRKGSGSLSVSVSIRSGDIDFSDILDSRGRCNINHYYLHNYGPHQNLFAEIECIIKYGSDRQWFDKSDAMVDYFHTAFYIDMSIGDYQKPYIYTGGKYDASGPEQRRREKLQNNISYTDQFDYLIN